MPIAMADHVPTQPAYGQDLTTDNNAGTITIGILGSDGFEDSPPENYTIFFSGSSGITETNSFCVTTSFGHQTDTWQYYTFSNDDLKYYFADLAGENFYFRIRSNNETDNSVSTLTTESLYNIYAGPPFEFNQTDWSAPTGTDACNPYVVTTTTTTTTVPLTIGVPTNQTATVDYENGTVTIDWDAPTDGNTSPERYAIGFGLNDEGTASPYGIATGNVGDENALNTEVTFTAGYLQSIFNEAHGLFNTAIRSDNDTNSLYSSWTSTISTTIQNKPAKVSNLASSIDNSGDNLTITWDANNNGFVSASNYKIFSKTDETQWTQVLVTTNTSYSFKATETNSWEFRVDACGSEGDCNSSSTNVTFNYTVPTTTTTPTTLPPPPPPPPPTTTLAPVEVIVMDDGTEAEYTTDQIAQGDVERDNERKANEDKWGCYVTNVALERGDCDAYNTALYESTTTTTTTIPEIKEEDVIVEVEVIDDKDIKEDKIIDDKPIPEDEISITEDEIIIEDEILEDFEDIVTDGDLVEDDVEEPVKEEILEDLPIVEEIIEEIPSVEETIIEVMEVIEIPEQDNTETAPKIDVNTLTEVQKEVVQQQVTKVTKTEDVKNMSPEEKTVAAAALGIQKEELEIVAELSENDESVSQAVEEYVERASEVPEGTEYTLADAITEVQVEAFLENPLQELTDISIEEFVENLANVSEIGNDMTNDQREKAQEVVVPVIIASQIIAQAGSLMRRF